MKENPTESSFQLQELPNIGSILEPQLLAIGITSYEDLKRIGSKQAWLKIQEIDESACIHKLLALEGAILQVKKSSLPTQTKEELREFYHWHKR
jgi:DNA transformation protein